ncbi:hypothetical protein D3C72_2365530 [compost metagenome]
MAWLESLNLTDIRLCLTGLATLVQRSPASPVMRMRPNSPTTQPRGPSKAMPFHAVSSPCAADSQRLP